MFLTEGCSSLPRSNKPGWVVSAMPLLMPLCFCGCRAGMETWQEQQHCCSHGGPDTSKTEVREIPSTLISTAEATLWVLDSILGPPWQERHWGVGLCPEKEHRAGEAEGPGWGSAWRKGRGSGGTSLSKTPWKEVVAKWDSASSPKELVKWPQGAPGEV